MATNAHTEVPGHKAPFPPFQKETFVSQLVWFVIAFIALYVLIKKLAIPQIGGIIEARTGKIEGDLAEAARLKDQSDAALKAYEASLADARGRAQALAQETRDRLLELAFTGQHDVINQAADNLARQPTRRFDRDAFGDGVVDEDRRFTFQRRRHRGETLRLDADHTHAGNERFYSSRDARDQPATADRN